MSCLKKTNRKSLISGRNLFPFRFVSLEAFKVLWQIPHNLGSTIIPMCKEETVVIFPSKIIIDSFWWPVLDQMSEDKLWFLTNVCMTVLYSKQGANWSPKVFFGVIGVNSNNIQGRHLLQTLLYRWKLPGLDGCLQYRCLHLSKSPQIVFTEPSSGHDFSDKM